jgi:hypothetical protein
LTVELLDRQVEAVADVDAEAGAGAGERRKQPDLDPIGRVQGTGEQQGGGEGSDVTQHRDLREGSQWHGF